MRRVDEPIVGLVFVVTRISQNLQAYHVDEIYDIIYDQSFKNHIDIFVSNIMTVYVQPSLAPAIYLVTSVW